MGTVTNFLRRNAWASDLADYVDQRVKNAEKPVLEYLDANPNMAKALVLWEASVKYGTPMGFINAPVVFHPGDTIRGTADMFRLGKGTAEAVEGGSKIGVLQDGLRGVGIVGTITGAAGAARVAVGARTAVVLADVQGGLCAPMAATRALRMTGRRLFMAVDEVVDVASKVTKHTPAELAEGGMNLKDLGTTMRRLGAKVTEAPNPLDMQGMEAIVRRARKTAIFHVDFFDAVGFKGAGHALVAFIDDAGRFRIWDRTGRIVSSLQELESLYPGISKLSTLGSPNAPVLLIDGLTVAPKAGGVGILALEVKAALAISQDEASPEMVVQAIESKIMRDVEGRIPERLPPAPVANLARPAKKAAPPRSDWLTGVKYRLNHLGYGAGPVVHLYDNKCKAAIRAFQRDYKLGVDGIPGPQTQGKLVAVCGY
ncbi:MAG TPA: peptidoglycan-binding domain-containing protein [Candidatus Angelobacter sp.]|nr:peptidoglycan-binding domain-containing protein [Candidatus Angelobacter sp.]